MNTDTTLGRRHALGTLLSLSLMGCASPKVQDYAGQVPAFDIRSFFDGKLQGQGIFFDRSDRVVKRFTVDMVGQWTGTRGTLDEHFHYSDGSQSTRLWHLEQLPQGRYSGQAGDVIGLVVGSHGGNAFHWRYTLVLPEESGAWHVELDDWMFLVDDKTVLNRTRMSKFGVDLGELMLEIRKA